MKKLVIKIRKLPPLIVLLALPIIILLSCIESPLSPLGPTYDIQLAVPLIDRSWLLGDFVKDTTFKVNNDGTLSYINSYSLQKKSVDSLTAHPEPDSDKTELGRFNVNGYTSPSIEYPASYFGFTVGGPPAVIPATSLTPIDTNHIVNNSEFDYVGVYNGTLTFSVTNNLPVPINFPAPIIIRNNWNSPANNNTIATFIITDTILPGTSRTPSVSLAGELVYGIMTIDPIQIHTPGSSGTVSFSSANNVTFSLQTTALRADSAYAIIRNQTILSDDTASFVVDDSITIKRATFKRGNLNIRLNNNIDLITTTHVRIEELKENSTQNVFVKDYIFNGLGILDTTLNIKDYYIESNRDLMGTVMHYSARIEIIESRGVKKRVSKNDFIQAKVKASDTLYARSVTGNFPTQHLNVNSGSRVDYKLKDINKSAIDSLRFKGLTVKVRAPISGSGTAAPPIDYNNLVLVAKNSKYNQTDIFPLPNGRLDPSTPEIDLPQVQTDNFVNSLIRFYPDLPDSLFVRGEFVVNPDFNPANSYTLEDTSAIYPYVDINIPSIVSISGGKVHHVQGIKEIISEDLAKSVKDGSLNLTFTNGIPVELTSKISFLGSDSLNHRDTLASFSSLGPINAAQIGLDSNSSIAAVSSIKRYLTGDQVVKISKADSVSIDVNMNTANNGAMVKLRNTDAVRVQVSTKLNSTVNKP